MFNRTRRLIGLDIGSNCVKAVELTQTGSEVVLTGYGQAEMVSEGSRADVGSMPGLDAWEGEARRREEREVEWYEDALSRVEDPHAVALLREILASERHHKEHLSGKWMPAGPTNSEEGT